MNTDTTPREIDMRRSIMRLELKPVTKLVLLGILDRVDWSTMSGEVSSTSVANILNHNRRSVVRAMSQLVELGFITRVSHRVESTKNTVSITTLNVSRIASSTSDTTSHSDTMSRGVVTPCLKGSDTMSRGVVTPCHTINNYQYNNNNQCKSDTTSHSDTMSLPKRKRLTTEQITAIEIECSKHSDHSHARRVQVAQQLFNIKLIRGGYYEAR